jgi:hypothetical protein
MAHAVPAGLTPAEGRRFGLLVGAAFLLLAGLSRWRGHDLAPAILATLGTILVAGGLLLPARLDPIHRGWMAFGLLLSRFTTPVFMGALYFLAITPMGLVMRAFGHRPLNPSRGAESLWVRHQSSSDHSMERQY